MGGKSGHDEQQRIQANRRQHAQTEIAFKEKIVDSQSEDLSPNDIVTPLTLDEAISYALTYNLDSEVKKLEQDILKESLAGARLKMLPSLTLDGEISSRNSYDASYSDPLFNTGEQDFNYSRDKTTQKFGVELSWDILNFGVAYYQQRQVAEQYNIAGQRRLRVIQNLKFDVAKTFWRALAARKAFMKTKDLLERLKEREEVLQRQLESLAKSEIELLELSVVISEMKMQLSGFDYKYQRYKERLSMLMGLPKTVEYELVDIDFYTRLIDTGDIDISALEMEALLHRPELFEQDMEETISLDDARIAVAKAMPKPILFYRYNYDGDSHLYEDQWHEVGIRLSFDLLTVPQQRSLKREAGIKNRLAKKRRQSMAAAVLTQLRLAVIDFEDTKREYNQTHEISDKRKQLMAAQSRHFESGGTAYETMIETEAKYLISEVRSLISYAELNIAEQRILNTVGSDDLGKSRFLTVKTPEPEPVLAQDESTGEESEPMDLRETDGNVSIDVETGKSPEQEEITEISPSDEYLAEGAGAQESDMEVVFSDEALTGESLADENISDTMVLEETVTEQTQTDEAVTGGSTLSPAKEPLAYQGLATQRPYSIQLYSTRTLKDATSRLLSYKKRGLKAYLVPISLKSTGLWWRCYEGSYETLDHAKKAQIAYGLRGSIIKETPYTVFLGKFAKKEDMNNLIRKLVSLKYSPYILKSNMDEYQLVVGAFYSMEKAEKWAKAMQGQHFFARGVRR